MLNIDYSDWRKFLMSFGFVMIFFWFAIGSGTVIYSTERIESLNNLVMSEGFNSTIYFNMNSTAVYNNIWENVDKALSMGMICAYIGFPCFFWGLSLWIYQTMIKKRK